MKALLALTLWVLSGALWAYPAFTFDHITNDHFQQVHYDAQGKPWLKIQGQSTVTEPSLNQTTLQNPLMSWDDAEGHWTLKAPTAVLDHRAQIIDYTPSVILIRHSNTEPTTTYKTTHLQVHLHTRLITSDQMVTITQGDRTMRSKGLSLHLQKKHNQAIVQP